MDSVSSGHFDVACDYCARLKRLLCISNGLVRKTMGWCWSYRHSVFNYVLWLGVSAWRVRASFCWVMRCVDFFSMAIFRQMQDCIATQTIGGRVKLDLFIFGIRCFLNTLAFLFRGVCCGALCCFLCQCGSLSHRRVGVRYALRVSPVVTRLTVHRRPQVVFHPFA